MSGIEIAGLALAVLPTLIEIAKQARAKNHAASRAGVMEDLCWEITQLSINLEGLVRQLPSNMHDEILSSTSPQQIEQAWKRDKVVQLLEARLGPKYHSFSMALENILGCLDRLLDKDSLRLSNDEVVTYLLVPGLINTEHSHRLFLVPLTQNFGLSKLTWRTQRPQIPNLDLDFGLPFTNRADTLKIWRRSLSITRDSRRSYRHCRMLPHYHSRSEAVKSKSVHRT